jgi:ABC-2 type transport system permease protein
VMILSYLASSLSFLNDKLALAARILPYHYYQAVMSIKDLNLAWLVSLIGISLVMTLLAYLRFSRRDIRLSGEGSWSKG